MAKDPDVKALERAVKAIKSSSSETAARAAVRYLYDAFVVNPAETTKKHWLDKHTEIETRNQTGRPPSY